MIAVLQKADTPSLETLRRQVRLVVLLDAAEKAGLTPLPILQVHSFAYFSNVLAPVWDLVPLEGKVLKRNGGPFYPSLQGDLDRLVGKGIALISRLSHVRDEDNRWRLEGNYRLNRPFAEPILDYLTTFDEESRLTTFLQELAYALSALSCDDIESAMTEDATYSDPLVDIGNVVDFAEWQQKNFSANAARYFDNLITGGGVATPGEKLHLYVRHLATRLHGAR